MVEIVEYKDAYVVSCENHVIGINVANYPNTMFEATYNYKKRANPEETEILIRTEYPKEVLEQVFEVLDGKRVLNCYNKDDADLIEIIQEFCPEYVPDDTIEDDDEDDFYDYYEPEEPKKKGPNYQEPFDFEEAERLLNEKEDALDRQLRCEAYDGFW